MCQSCTYLRTFQNARRWWRKQLYKSGKGIQALKLAVKAWNFASIISIHKAPHRQYWCEGRIPVITIDSILQIQIKRKEEGEETRSKKCTSSFQFVEYFHMIISNCLQVILQTSSHPPLLIWQQRRMARGASKFENWIVWPHICMTAITPAEHEI